MQREVVELARRQAEICRLFGNPIRVMILWALKQHAMNVSDLASAAHASVQNTSQHLRLMKDRGILTAQREGNTIVYRICAHADMQGCRLLALADQLGPVQLAESKDFEPA
jgi:ArsR family transcriptional regulator